MPDDPTSTYREKGLSPDACAPADLKLNREQQTLFVKWRDGRESVFPAVVIRKNCPCAACRTDREKQTATLMPILKQAPSSIKLVNAQLVGTYAIQLFWSDGHDAGIFDFRYLRALDDGSLTQPRA